MQVYASKLEFSDEMTDSVEVEIAICDETGDMLISRTEEPQFKPERPAWRATAVVTVGLCDDPEDGAFTTGVEVYEWTDPDGKIVERIPAFSLRSAVEELDLWASDQEWECDAWSSHYAAEARWVANECGFAINSM